MIPVAVFFAYVNSVGCLKLSQLDQFDKGYNTPGMENTILVFFAGIVAGTINSVAGGGSFVTLPALMATGMPSVFANATSTFALYPGSLAGAYAYRYDYAGLTGLPVKMLLGVSLAGGFVGAILLRLTPTAVFDWLIPWLLLLATVAFALGPKLGRMLHGRLPIGPISLLIGQGLLGVYGGYFGGAVGILMMAIWTIFGVTDIKAMNAAKTISVGVTNATAVVLFSLTGMVYWPEACTMLTGAVIGGYGGARWARGISPHRLRTGMTFFNVAMTLFFFLRVYG